MNYEQPFSAPIDFATTSLQQELDQEIWRAQLHLEIARHCGNPKTIAYWTRKLKAAKAERQQLSGAGRPRKKPAPTALG